MFSLNGFNVFFLQVVILKSAIKDDLKEKYVDIGLRQAYVLGFEKRFPLVFGLLKRNVETVCADLFAERNSKPQEYKFQLSIEYYPESEKDRPIGELVTAPDGRTFYETRSLAIVGHYTGRSGDTKTALLALNLMKPNSELPEEEIKDIGSLFGQIKSYPLDSIPKEIQV